MERAKVLLAGGRRCRFRAEPRSEFAETSKCERKRDPGRLPKAAVALPVAAAAAAAGPRQQKAASSSQPNRRRKRVVGNDNQI